jgi:hypothetical protein
MVATFNTCMVDSWRRRAGSGVSLPASALLLSDHWIVMCLSSFLSLTPQRSAEREAIVDSTSRTLTARSRHLKTHK